MKVIFYTLRTTAGVFHLTVQGALGQPVIIEKKNFLIYMNLDPIFLQFPIIIPTDVN